MTATENLNQKQDQVCVLWHPESGSPSPALVKVMGKRGFSIAPVSSQHLAFAAMCKYAKSSRRVVLVLDARGELVGVDRVLDAMERFAPSAICWQHTEGANPPIIPLVRTERKQAEPVKERTDSHTAGQSDPELRLVGKEQAQEKPSANQIIKPTVLSTPSQPLNTRDVLDADELDALLAGELGDERKRK